MMGPRAKADPLVEVGPNKDILAIAGILEDIDREWPTMSGDCGSLAIALARVLGPERCTLVGSTTPTSIRRRRYCCGRAAGRDGTGEPRFRKPSG
jgi:hypothetical protein